jgi:phosphoribosylanthranilate isomerase
MGVDHLGVEVHEGREPVVSEIMRAVRGKVTVSLLPLYDDLERTIAVTQDLQPEILHLCESDLTPDAGHFAALRARLGAIRIMQAIPVGPPEIADRFDSLALAKAYDPYVDVLLLDTSLGDDQDNPVPGWIGITGRTHDWRISRQIVEQCSSPVIVAGGLNPGNVADAIRKVRPWGVDSCTGTDLYRGKKDLPKCRAFIENARQASLLETT